MPHLSAGRGAAFVWLLAAAAVASVHAALFPANSPVLQLGPRTFKPEVLSVDKPTFVAFTAPWCGHCQRLAPDFHKAASKLDGVVKFANVDCDVDENRAICSQYGVQGFPTIKFFPATKKRLPRDYRGERSAKELVRYASDQFPQAARKLQPSEIELYARQHPDRPKVLLFSAKPTSSVLFRSLALDHRSSIPFAWVRGDAGLARSNARLALGLDIPTAEQLPVLVMIPAARPAASAGEQEPDAVDLEAIRGRFETYVGAMKYRPIKAWIDRTAPKLGYDASAKPNKKHDFAAPPPPPAKPKAKSKPRSKGTGKVGAVDEDEVPEGGTVEWKLQATDPDVPGLDEVRRRAEEQQKEKQQQQHQREADTGSGGDAATGEGMLSKERAQVILDKINELKAKLPPSAYAEPASPPAEEGSGKQASSSDGRDTPSQAEGAGAGTSAETEAEAESEGPSLAEAARKVLDSAAEKGASAAGSAAEALQDAKARVVGSLADRLGSVGKIPGSEMGGPYEAKRRALMKSFEKWMTGEHNDWAEQHGDDFARAQREAEELLRADPEEADRQAAQSEGWMLEELRQDRKKMESVMTPQQLANVDEMIELIEGRLSKRRQVAAGKAKAKAAAAAHDEL